MFDSGLEEHGCGDDGEWEWDDWDEETYDLSELNEWDDWPRHEIEANDWADWLGDLEPPDLEFGGRLYPAGDVQAARELRGVTK